MVFKEKLRDNRHAITISCEPPFFIIDKCDASVANDAPFDLGFRVPKSAAAGMAVPWGPCAALHEPVPAGHARSPASSDVKMGARMVEHAVNRRAASIGGEALGCTWPTASPKNTADAPPLERVLDGQGAESSSRPPLWA